ncbi:MAG: T9SS type A sorting domain-containing protein, partial [Ignavibacteriae bacterium]|nr:T9SS type A sorting domain-containing protein [Ignavibacteriota bacterium]
PVYDESLKVILRPASDITVVMPAFTIPISPLAGLGKVAADGPFGSYWRKPDSDPIQPQPLGKGKCGFVLLSVQDNGDGSFTISKQVVNRKTGPCPWSISFYWDDFGVNSGLNNLIGAPQSGTVAMGDPPADVSTTWTPPGPGKYCVFAKTTIQGKTFVEYFNGLTVKNQPPPPPMPPPPPPPPPPSGWPPLPPGKFWDVPIPLHRDTVACPDSIPIELVALQLQGSPWYFVPPRDTAYVKCAGSDTAYLSVYVPDSAAGVDSSVFTVIAKNPGPGGLEIGSATITVRPDIAVSVGRDYTLPRTAVLYQNYPNPFNPTTTIRFDLPKLAAVTLTVYNSLGSEVASLLHGVWMEAGSHVVHFDASGQSNGVYFYRLSVGEFQDVKAMILLK